MVLDVCASLPAAPRRPAAGRRADGGLGRTGPGPPRPDRDAPRGTGPLRDRPGWHGRRPAHPERPSHGGPRLRRLRHRGPVGGGATRGDAGDPGRHGARTADVDRPRYLMGVGDPVGMLEAVALGVDQFDCVAPTRAARHGTIWTSSGRLNLRNAVHASDDRPLDPGCACPTCARWSRGYLRHLLTTGEPTALTAVQHPQPRLRARAHGRGPGRHRLGHPRGPGGAHPGGLGPLTSVARRGRGWCGPSEHAGLQSGRRDHPYPPPEPTMTAVLAAVGPSSAPRRRSPPPRGARRSSSSWSSARRSTS